MYGTAQFPYSPEILIKGPARGLESGAVDDGNDSALSVSEALVSRCCKTMGNARPTYRQHPGELLVNKSNFVRLPWRRQCRGCRFGLAVLRPCNGWWPTSRVEETKASLYCLLEE